MSSIDWYRLSARAFGHVLRFLMSGACIVPAVFVMRQNEMSVAEVLACVILLQVGGWFTFAPSREDVALRERKVP